MTIIQGEIARTNLTADQLMVPIDSEVFNSHPEASFYVGEVAMHGMVCQPELYRASGILRANVYIDQMHFLPPSARLDDGTERDLDDDRSVHFAVVENMGSGVDPRVIGTSRLVIKRSLEEELPAEHYFPEAFSGSERAPLRSAEVSRFAARHPDKDIQRRASLSLIRASASWMSNHVHRPAYAVVESGLLRMFDNMSLPYERISEFKRLPEYNGTRNRAVLFEPARVLQEIKAERHVASPEMQAFFGQTYVHKGIGYFDKTMTRILG